MEIFDKKNNLIAIIHFATDFKEGKNFYTKEDADFQFGSFSLKAGENIDYHIHNIQERNINKTSEGIVVISGKMNIELFDESKELLFEQDLNTGDAILIFQGGHWIKMIDDCKFLEFKQGPYDEKKDKKYF